MLYETGAFLLSFTPVSWYYFIKGNAQYNTAEGGTHALVSLLLPVIYLAFISLGLPDSLQGAAWPMIYPVFGVPVSYMGF